MPVLHVEVRNKQATYLRRDGSLVCGNGDYSIQFTFDDEWNDVTEKTARFIWNGEYQDVDFSGDTCAVPLIERTDSLSVGVYTDELQTTTSATIPCLRSIRCEGVPPSSENDKAYANEAKEAASRAEGSASEAQEAATRAGSAANRAETAADHAEKPLSDYNATEGEYGHIKNRPFYTDPDGTVHKLDNKYIDAGWMATIKEDNYTNVVIPRQKMSGNSAMWSNRKIDIQPGITYAVHIDDEVYMCVAYSAGDGVRLGNNTSLSENDIPFCITWAGGSATGGMFFTDGSFGSTCYLEVMGEGSTVTEYNKMPEEFLPDCVVKSVNGNAPDENGNVEVEGGADIDVTAQVGQTIIVKEVDANGKPTKWEAVDYQPRTHWQGEKVMMQYTFSGEADGVNSFISMPAMGLTAGKTYTVILGDDEYTLVAQAGRNANLGADLIWLGNPVIVGGTPDATPFCIADVVGSDCWIATGMAVGTQTKTMTIVGSDEAHTIPTQYLKEGFPHILLTQMKTQDGATYYEVYETVTDLMEIYNSGREIDLRVTAIGLSAIYSYHLVAYESTELGGKFTFASLAGVTGLIPIMLELSPQENGTYVIQAVNP